MVEDNKRKMVQGTKSECPRCFGSVMQQRPRCPSGICARCRQGPGSTCGQERAKRSKREAKEAQAGAEKESGEEEVEEQEEIGQDNDDHDDDDDDDDDDGEALYIPKRIVKSQGARFVVHWEGYDDPRDYSLEPGQW